MLFEKATRLKLKVQTHKGYLSTEDLWDLSLSELNSVAKALNKQIKVTEEEDFLDDLNKEDEIVKLKFDLALYILKIKKDERKSKREASAKKDERNKILAILAKKQDDSLESLSEDELKKKLEELK